MRIHNINLTRWEMIQRDYEAFALDKPYQDSTPVHYHTDFYEVYFFEAGSVLYNIEMTQYRLVPGDMLLIPPNTMHWPLIENPALPYRRMFIWLNQSYLQGLCSPSTDLTACFDRKRYVIHLDAYTVAEVSRLIEGLIACSAQGSDHFGTDVNKKALVTLLMLLVNRAYQNPEATAKEAVPLSTPIQQVTAYIHEHLEDTDLNLDFLAKRFLISKSALTRSFFSQTGMNLHQYIIKRRMFLAHQLLLSGTQANKVCLMAGYGDYSSFYRAFVKEFGLTPGEVGRERNALQSGEPE